MDLESPGDQRAFFMCDFMGVTPSQKVTSLPRLMEIGILLMEILWF